MSAWELMSAAERTEVEAGVVAAYVDPETRETRSTVDAKADFREFVRSAEQAGRPWATVLLDEWADRGAGNFAAELWKRRDAFTTSVKGVQRSRSLRRGKKVVTDAGERVDVQASLLDWSLDDLTDAIAAEGARAKEARINLDTYAALVRLVKRSGTEPIGAALRAVGMSLDEYLAAEDKRAAS